MGDQVETPSREAIKAEANFQRTARRFTDGRVGSDTYVSVLCTYLIRMHTALKAGPGPAFVVIDYRTQELLDTATEGFEDEVTGRVVQECDEIELTFMRDFGKARSTKISVIV